MSINFSTFALVMINKQFLQSISLPNEEWREISGYESRYVVSNLGRVAALYHEHTTRPYGKEQKISIQPHLLKLTKFTNTQYCYVMFRKDGKRFKYSVHRLVANAFLPNPDNLPQIDHIDSDKSNNAVTNLRWCNAFGNMSNPITREKISRGKKGKPSWRSAPVLQIKDGVVVAEYSSVYETRLYGFTHQHVQSCVQHKLPSHKGYTWVLKSEYESLNNISK